MKTGKFEHVARGNRQMGYKSVAVLLALVLLMGTVVGGTLAWLLDQTDPVTNTFTVGNINLDLYEHTRDKNGYLTENETKKLEDYKILPGTSEKKDPTVEILANSDNCYVFVQVQEISNDTGNAAADGVATKYITYTVDNSVWSPLLDDNDHVHVNGAYVYYATTNYETQASDKHYNVLKDQTVSYSEDLTKTDMDKLYTYNDDGTVKSTTKPQLIFKAFAVQKEAANDELAAWDKVADSEKLGYIATNP